MLRLLILGGTGDAAELTTRVATLPGIEAIASFAGCTREPSLPSGHVRVGGFGGAAGLAQYLRQMQVDFLIDATHPFAAQISRNAVTAAAEVGIPHLMLIRPPWAKVPGDRWIEVDSHTSAAQVLHSEAKRVFLTVGRQELAAFAHLQDIWFLMRMIDPPAGDAVVPRGEILCDRGPFHLDQERQILLKYNIDTVVSKNSGGNATYPKIVAARDMGLLVIMVKRPTVPPGKQVSTVDDAVDWLLGMLRAAKKI